jgi:hypothetical protein
MFKKMQRAMQEISYFQKLKETVGEELFTRGVEMANFFLQLWGYRKAKRLFVSALCRSLLFEDIERAKKYAVALEVLEDFKRNQKA